MAMKNPTTSRVSHHARQPVLGIVGFRLACCGAGILPAAMYLFVIVLANKP